MKTLTAAVLFAATMFAAGIAGAQGANAAAQGDSTSEVTDMQALRNAVRSGKKAYVASALNLTEAEGKKFWPAYDAYQRKVDVTNRDRVIVVEGVIGRDRPVSDLYARNMAKELISIDEAEVKARRVLHNAIIKSLPPRKAFRYLQLESKIRAVQAYDIAATIPLVK